VVLIVYAHPHPQRSIAHRLLTEAVRDLPATTLHPLYDRYPDFAIDATHERELLAGARLIVWQHPLYWYSVPALLQLWFEQVLVRGWAFGDGGTALAGKHCLWVTSTGGMADSYAPAAPHGHPFASFVPNVMQRARFCGMHWQPPLVVHGAHRSGSEELQRHAADYRRRLQDWIDAHRDSTA
jgi:glutathione-regulated potassium-efflux system ancillary protein KefF